jgi:RES domain
MPLELVASPGALYRVGRWPNPFSWRRPLFRLSEAPAPHDGYRWDAPTSDFATLYFGTDPLACFVETLAYYRRHAAFNERLRAATDEDAPDAEYEFALGSGTVPESYFDRVLGHAILATEHKFIDVDHPRTHAQLSDDLPDLLATHGLREIDRGVMMTQDRSITRTVAGYLHAYASTSSISIGGIRYESRIHTGLECWAVWAQHAEYLVDRDIDPLTPDTPGVKEAADLLELKLPITTSGTNSEGLI